MQGGKRGTGEGIQVGQEKGLSWAKSGILVASGQAKGGSVALRKKIRS